MSRIAAALARCRGEGRTALMPFMTIGYPDFESSIALVEAMAAAGADGMELGIPFSDPLADGPTIQKASYKSLQNGTTYANVVDAVRRLRKRGVEVPLILMGYCNTFLALGEERAISDAA